MSQWMKLRTVALCIVSVDETGGWGGFGSPSVQQEKDSMIVGKVVGSIVSTRKCENLIGNKFMIIEPLEEMAGSLGRFVAIDKIGAGIGETVLVATGSAARVGMEAAPVDAAIVGIVDE